MTWLVFCPHREEKSQPDSAVVAISRYFSLAAVPERPDAASTSFLACHDSISACSGKSAASYGCCTGPQGLYQHVVQRCCYTVRKHELRLGGPRSTQLTCSPLVWAQWSLRST